MRTKSSLTSAVKPLALLTDSPKFLTNKGKPGSPALQISCTVAGEFQPISLLKCQLTLGGRLWELACPVGSGI